MLSSISGKNRFKLFKRAVKTKDRNTWADYKRLRNEITSDLRKAKAAYFRDQLKKAKTTSAYWNVLSKATNPKVRKKIGPLKRDDNSLAVKDTEKASLMNCFFSTIAEKLNAGQLQAPQLLTSPCSKPVPCISDINLSSLDIDRKITLLKNNKATGPDGISPKLLKLAGTAVVGPLTSLFMQSIRECRVYNNWKVARLTPVFKKDDPTVMSNYRPLSLLSVPSKILESCVADMIAKHVFSENEALVTDNQWAYRKRRSTELLLIHLTETWRRAIDNKLVVDAVFLDFQKAFDRVSHSILLHKLEHNFEFTGNLLAWLRDYLSEREQYTVINGVPSENTKVASGISQGSILGPILFALYTSDLPKAVNTATTFLYADDTTMYCVGESVDQVTTTLNKALEELALWCKHISLVLHAKKCERMILKRNL